MVKTGGSATGSPREPCVQIIGSDGGPRRSDGGSHDGSGKGEGPRHYMRGRIKTRTEMHIAIVALCLWVLGYVGMGDGARERVTIAERTRNDSGEKEYGEDKWSTHQGSIMRICKQLVQRQLYIARAGTVVKKGRRPDAEAIAEQQKLHEYNRGNGQPGGQSQRIETILNCVQHVLMSLGGRQDAGNGVEWRGRGCGRGRGLGRGKGLEGGPESLAKSLTSFENDTLDGSDGLAIFPADHWFHRLHIRLTRHAKWSLEIQHFFRTRPSSPADSKSESDSPLMTRFIRDQVDGDKEGSRFVKNCLSTLDERSEDRIKPGGKLHRRRGHFASFLRVDAEVGMKEECTKNLVVKDALTNKLWVDQHQVICRSSTSSKHLEPGMGQSDLRNAARSTSLLPSSCSLTVRSRTGLARVKSEEETDSRTAAEIAAVSVWGSFMVFELGAVDES
ncbi:hypothetical protein C8R43DRAFT_951248 [Mycena crocata]|nr:hypothetical protein C8R43DRAFT_951248 [Mycena crocata]